MSHLHGSSLIAGAHVFGGGGLGTLAESIPANGDKGPGYAYKGLSFPADNGKEIRGQVITPPSGGSFFAYNDTSYTLIGASDGPYWFDWKLWVDGVPSAVDIGYGAGIARVFLQVGPAYSAVSVTTDDAVFSGGAGVYAGASSSINATTDDAVFSGSTVVGGGFSGSISDADIARIVSAVLAALQATAIPVNVKKVNDRTVVGQGLAPPNHWRPE